jgi:hypothetical protein
MRPLGTVVGYASNDGARVLAIFPAGVSHARLVFQSAEHDAVAIDVELADAPPFRLAHFSLQGLPRSPIEYSVLGYRSAAEAPALEHVQSINAGTFRPLPERPLRIALVSCNDIDNPHFAARRRGALWRRLAALVQRGEVDVVVHAGDQIYGDVPAAGWQRAEGAAANYRRHYVNTWTHPDVASVLANCPNLMMWDDHEIYDGWGSNDADKSAPAQERYAAAAQAFADFQAALNPPDRFTRGFGWALRNGSQALIALDGRSQRSWADRSVLGSAQLDEFTARLHALRSAGLRQLFVVLSTPIVYVPVLAGEQLARFISPDSLADVRDAWTVSNNRGECRRLLMALLEFEAASPETQVTLLSGDVHVGTVAQIDTLLRFGPEQRTPRLYQVTSSAIGRPAPSGLLALMLRLLIGGRAQKLLHQDIIGALRPLSGADHEYLIRHRNFAVVDTVPTKLADSLRVRFHSEQRDDCVVELVL